MLSDLDGFLIGIAVRPELVMPSEWLPIIFGGEVSEFADPREKPRRSSARSWIDIMGFSANSKMMISNPCSGLDAKAR